MEDSNDWLTTKETAVELGISRRQVYSLIKQGRLPARKFMRDWVIQKNDLDPVRKNPVTRKRLTREQVQEVQRLRKAGETLEEIAKHFGVSAVTIFRHINPK